MKRKRNTRSQSPWGTPNKMPDLRMYLQELETAITEKVKKDGLQSQGWIIGPQSIPVIPREIWGRSDIVELLDEVW